MFRCVPCLIGLLCFCLSTRGEERPALNFAALPAVPKAVCTCAVGGDCKCPTCICQSDEDDGEFAFVSHRKGRRHRQESPTPAQAAPVVQQAPTMPLAPHVGLGAGGAVPLHQPYAGGPGSVLRWAEMPQVIQAPYQVPRTLTYTAQPMDFVSSGSCSSCSGGQCGVQSRRRGR